MISVLPQETKTTLNQLRRGFYISVYIQIERVKVINMHHCCIFFPLQELYVIQDGRVVRVFFSSSPEHLIEMKQRLVLR